MGGRSSRYWCCPGPVRETNGRSSERYQAVGRPASSYQQTRLCTTGDLVAGFLTRRTASAVWIGSMTPGKMGLDLRIRNSRSPRSAYWHSGRHACESVSRVAVANRKSICPGAFSAILAALRETVLNFRRWFLTFHEKRVPMSKAATISICMAGNVDHVASKELKAHLL